MLTLDLWIAKQNLLEVYFYAKLLILELLHFVLTLGFRLAYISLEATVGLVYFLNQFDLGNRVCVDSQYLFDGSFVITILARTLDPCALCILWVV